MDLAQGGSTLSTVVAERSAKACGGMANLAIAGFSTMVAATGVLCMMPKEIALAGTKCYNLVFHCFINSAGT